MVCNGGKRMNEYSLMIKKQFTLNIYHSHIVNILFALKSVTDTFIFNTPT